MPTESRHRAATGLPGLILVSALTTWAGTAEAGPLTIRLITAPPARATTARPLPPKATPRGCHTVWHWPLHGPLTSGYGPRHHPILRLPRFHSGLDLAAPMGARVRAGAAGRVRRAGWDGYRAVQTALGDPLYLLTPDVAQRFRIERVPARVEARGETLVVVEWPPEG